MKKIIILLLSVFALLSAEETENDSGRTSISPGDVEYYDIIDDRETGESKPYADMSSDRPFALRQPSDRWFSYDKWMHLSSSYFLTMQSAYLFENMLFTDPLDSRNISVGITFSLSLGKEFYDVFVNEGIFSWKDLFYDILGTSLGYLTLSALGQ
ncbi:MAG: hypothetical protein R6V48_07515 [Fidelibacterota bacterium]